MREIKFRGRSIEKSSYGEWWEGYYVYSKKENKHYIVQDAVIHGNMNQFVGFSHFAIIDPKTLEQI